MAQYPFRQDFAQDYLGARALFDRDAELYPILASAYEELGIHWNAVHRSTHPPTAFLLVAPFAALPYRLSQVAWMLAMFACLVLAARFLDLDWWKSILASIAALAWPPTIWSLAQLTPVWLLGLVLAYRFRRHHAGSGAWIAFASLPKLFAAPALLYHIRRRQWSAILGFGSVWLAALALLLLVRPDALFAYLQGATDNSVGQVLRRDNGGLLATAWRLGGLVGLAEAAALILWVVWSGLRREGPAGWACLVWLGVALLPVCWVYSLLPLLPWLLLTLRSPDITTRVLASAALLVPYAGPAAVPAGRAVLVALCVVLSGFAFAASARDEAQDSQGPGCEPAERQQRGVRPDGSRA